MEKIVSPCKNCKSKNRKKCFMDCLRLERYRRKIEHYPGFSRISSLVSIGNGCYWNSRNGRIPIWKEVRKMVIGFDVDGVLTTLPIRINFKLPWWLGLFLVLVPPKKRMLEILKKQKANNKIILISARPKQLERLTRLWLKRYLVLFGPIW